MVFKKKNEAMGLPRTPKKGETVDDRIEAVDGENIEKETGKNSKDKDQASGGENNSNDTLAKKKYEEEQTQRQS